MRCTSERYVPFPPIMDARVAARDAIAFRGTRRESAPGVAIMASHGCPGRGVGEGRHPQPTGATHREAPD
jgi:hypothetical protein